MQKARIMTTKKRALIKKQKSLMQERAMFEYMQTEHGDDAEFCRYCQHNMDRLDEEAERIRIDLEMGCWK